MTIDYASLEDKVLLDYIVKKQSVWVDKGGRFPCPRCLVNDLDNDVVMNSTSRLNNEVYICNDCGNDEALADVGMFPKVRAKEWEIFSIIK